jgi:hypothetical protein
MEKYVRVPKKQQENAAAPNEIRVTNTGKVRAIIGYAMSLLNDVRKIFV